MPNDVLLDLGKTKCGFGRFTLLWLILFYSNLPLITYNYDKKVHTVVINNSTKINKNEQSPHRTQRKPATYGAGNPDPDFGHAQKCGGVGHSKSLSYELS